MMVKAGIGLQQTHNKRMQTDQNARYALILTADARRSASKNMIIEKNTKKVLETVTHWILLLSQEKYDKSFGLLENDPNSELSPSVIKEIITSYELSPQACDDSNFSIVTPVETAKVVDYRPDQEVDWYEDNPDDNFGMVHHSLPINGIWSDLTAIFRLHRKKGGVALMLEDIHVM